jgi:two-component system, LytTR family, sensor kinase
MFSHRYRYFFILALSLYTYVNTVICRVYYYFQIHIEWYYAFAAIFFVTFLSWEGCRLIEPWLLKRIDPSRYRFRYIAVFFLTGAFISFLAALAVVYITGRLLHDYTWEQNINPLKLNLIYGGLVALLFHLINTIFLFFKEYKSKLQEAEELKRMNVQAQLQLVQSQINPHFLFNNLNVLSGMLVRDNPEANHFIEEFSKVYRYILTNQDKELVPVKEELHFIEPYIFLLQQRFTSGLQIDIDVQDKYREYYIIPAALQMLIENAIKHNVVSVRQPLHIIVHANGDESIKVSNNIQPRQTAEPSTRIGLENIARRYELLNQKDIVITKDTKTFEVILPLIRLN